MTGRARLRWHPRTRARYHRALARLSTPGGGGVADAAAAITAGLLVDYARALHRATGETACPAIAAARGGARTGAGARGGPPRDLDGAAALYHRALRPGPGSLVRALERRNFARLLCAHRRDATATAAVAAEAGGFGVAPQ